MRYCILVSPKTSVNRDAVDYGKPVPYVHTSQIMELFEKCREMLFDCRQLLRTNNTENSGDIVFAI